MVEARRVQDLARERAFRRAVKDLAVHNSLDGGIAGTADAIVILQRGEVDAAEAKQPTDAGWSSRFALEQMAAVDLIADPKVREEVRNGVRIQYEKALIRESNQQSTSIRGGLRFVYLLALGLGLSQVGLGGIDYKNSSDALANNPIAAKIAHLQRAQVSVGKSADDLFPLPQNLNTRSDLMGAISYATIAEQELTLVKELPDLAQLMTKTTNTIDNIIQTTGPSLRAYIPNLRYKDFASDFRDGQGKINARIHDLDDQLQPLRDKKNEALRGVAGWGIFSGVVALGGLRELLPKRKKNQNK